MIKWFHLVAWIVWAQNCAALKCYFCGTEDAHETNKPNTDPTDIASHSGSCHDFETKIAYPIRQYVHTCGDDHDYYNSYLDPASDETIDSKPLCVKFVTRSVHNNQFYTQRGCTSVTTRTGKVHKLGCGPTMMNRDDFMSNGIGGGGSGDGSQNSWGTGGGGEFNISTVEHICFCDTEYCNRSPSLTRTRLHGGILVHLLVFVFLSTILYLN